MVGNDLVKVEFRQVSANTVELWNITVDRSLRKQGLGKKVMHAIMTAAQEMDIDLQLIAVAQDASRYDDFFKETLRLRKWYYDLGFEYQKDSPYLVW